jgi:hypothetical protein
MENYIDRYDLRAKRILHIGIGNSGLAARFHERVKEIVGTTIDEPEIRVGRSLTLSNYRVFLHNKFSGESIPVDGKFDLILDNNPTSSCCCVRHLAVLFEFYDKKLASGGQVVTDCEGLAWLLQDSNPRWSFDFEDLAAAGAMLGLSAYRATGTVYVLSRSPPTKPGRRALARHLGRRALGVPKHIARHGLQKLARIARKLAR